MRTGATQHPGPEMVGDRHPGVDGGVLGDEADPGQLRRPGRGALAQDGDRAAGRREHPGGQPQQGGLSDSAGILAGSAEVHPGECLSGGQPLAVVTTYPPGVTRPDS
jgi:hypothetical protein